MKWEFLSDSGSPNIAVSQVKYKCVPIGHQVLVRDVDATTEADNGTKPGFTKYVSFLNH